MKFYQALVIFFAMFFWSIMLNADVIITKNIDYKSQSNDPEDRDLLDIYMPKDAVDVPVIVFFHGGALLYGDKSYGKDIAIGLVERGYGLVSANYRLSPNHSHPSHVNDAAEATAWVINNIDSYGGDSDNVFIAGHSAGAYLATLVSIDNSMIEKNNVAHDKLKGTILISPFLYIEETAPQRIASNAVYASIWGETKQDWLSASVTPFIGPDHNNILVIYADGDDAWRKEQNTRFVQDLKSEGCTNIAAIEVPDRNHKTIMSKIPDQDDQIVDVISHFISQLELSKAHI